MNAKKKNFFAGLLLGLLGLGFIMLFAVFTFSKISSFSLDLSFLNVLKLSQLSSIDPQKEKVNILLTGIGGGLHDGGELTDTIILASINVKKKTVTMLSIPRDLYVEYPGGGEGRINELYKKGRASFSESKAMSYLKDKIEQITGEKTDYFLNIDFSGFTKFVDILGGIEVNVPEDLVDTEYPDWNYGYETFRIKKGKQILDGSVALKYARSRHSTNDFDRSLRQQLVIKAIKDKLLSMNYIGNISKLKALFYTLSSHIKTDMGIREMAGLAGLSKEIPNGNIFSFNLNDSCQGLTDACTVGGFLYTPDRAGFGGASVLLPEDAIANDLSQYGTIMKFCDIIFNAPEIFQEKAEINIINTTKVSGLANRFALVLKRYGFTIPEKDSILSSKERMPKSQILHVWDPQTKTGIPKESKTLDTLSQFILAEPAQESMPRYSKNPGTKIEIVLGDDYRLFLNTVHEAGIK